MRTRMSNEGRAFLQRRSRRNGFHSKPLLDELRKPSRYPDMFCIIAFTRLHFAPGKWSRQRRGQRDRNRNKRPKFGLTH